jgi:hypothetical protein
MINTGTTTTHQTVMVRGSMPYYPAGVHAGGYMSGVSGVSHCQPVRPARATGLGARAGRYLRRLKVCQLDRVGPSLRRATSRWFGEPAG